MDSAAPTLPRLRYFAIYAVGFFCLSTVYMMAVLVPLWVGELAFAPFVAGFVIGSRGICSSLLAIHGGALMDRLGPRRVVLCCSFLAFLTPPLYAAITWAPAMVPLQMVSGLVTSITWIGAYAIVGQLIGANSLHMGRLSFAARMGTLCGPPLIGVIYDFVGFKGAFLFMSFWGAILFVSTLLMPAGTGSAPAAERILLRDVLPRWSDYRDSFRLLATPAVALIAIASIVGIGSGSIQSSFYLVHLQEQGFSGSLIGGLIGVASLCAAVSTLLTYRVERFMDPYLLLVSSAVVSMVMIAIAPLFASPLVILILLSVRGAAEGMNQPLLFSLMSDNVGVENQGRAVGLRISLNRGTTASMPMLMGMVLHILTLQAAFLAVGLVLVSAMLFAGVVTMRSGGLKG